VTPLISLGLELEGVMLPSDCEPEKPKGYPFENVVVV
jgi:hypothetical protein